MPRGTFIDTYRALAALAGQHLQHPLEAVTGDAVYTCADGSGTFHLLKHGRLVATRPGQTTQVRFRSRAERAHTSA
jgi:Fe2+ or Zn2+ uptake regulation protein